ncbi:MAG: HipA domain-containing protein [Chitinophagaceae bacterium]
MMKCLSCYRPSENDYCLSCRKKLFNKKRVSSRLQFELAGIDIETNQVYPLCLNDKKLEWFDQEKISSSREFNAYYFVKVNPFEGQFKKNHDLIENEHLTLQIADQVYGIQTVANALIYTANDIPAFIYRRYDLTQDKNSCAEDFEQLSHKVKVMMGSDFHFDGNYEEVAKLIKKYVSAYLPALEELFKRVIFNYLFSVTHLSFKDFSIIKTTTGECKLAPAHHLFNMQIHDDRNLDTQLNMYKDIHTSSQLSMQRYLKQAHFLEFADRIGIMKKRALRILNQFQDIEQPVIELVQLSFLKETTRMQYIEMFKRKLSHLQG